MKIASVPGSTMSPQPRGMDAGFGGKSRIFALSAALPQLLRSLADSLPAIGLAEGGDTDGAAELMVRSRTRKS